MQTRVMKWPRIAVALAISAYPPAPLSLDRPAASSLRTHCDNPLPASISIRNLARRRCPKFVLGMAVRTGAVVPSARHLESFNQSQQFRSIAPDRHDRRGHFFRQGGVLLGRRIDLSHTDVDFCQLRGLLF